MQFCTFIKIDIMAETRRMHYVPRTYLKYFANERNGEFYIHALNKETKKIFSPNINKICLETDLYLLEGETEDERQILEKMYNNLYERDYANLYKILTNDKRETVTMQERYDIIGFVVSMFYRNNSWNTGYKKLIDETYAKAYYLTKESGQDKFLFGEQEISIIGKTLDELQSESQAKDRQLMALITAQKIFELIRLRILNDVVTIVKTKHELVTSDNPVKFRGENRNQRPIPMDPTNTLSIPIDKNHLLQLRPWGHELDRTMLGRMSEFSFVSALTAECNNQFQYGQTGRFLLGTETGIKNFQPDLSGETFKKLLREKLK